MIHESRFSPILYIMLYMYLSHIVHESTVEENPSHDSQQSDVQRTSRMVTLSHISSSDRLRNQILLDDTQMARHPTPILRFNCKCKTHTRRLERWLEQRQHAWLERREWLRREHICQFRQIGRRRLPLRRRAVQIYQLRHVGRRRLVAQRRAVQIYQLRHVGRRRLPLRRRAVQIYQLRHVADDAKQLVRSAAHRLLPRCPAPLR